MFLVFKWPVHTFEINKRYQRSVTSVLGRILLNVQHCKYGTLSYRNKILAKKYLYIQSDHHLVNDAQYSVNYMT